MFEVNRPSAQHYPITLNFGKLPEGAVSTVKAAAAAFSYDPRTVGFWINTVPVLGIPDAQKEPVLFRYFLDWVASDYGYGVPPTQGPVIGVELDNGHISIPPLGRQELLAAHFILPQDGEHAYRKYWVSPTYLVVEVVSPYQAVVRGFFDEYDIDECWIEEEWGWAVVPEHAIRVK